MDYTNFRELYDEDDLRAFSTKFVKNFLKEYFGIESNDINEGSIFGIIFELEVYHIERKLGGWTTYHLRNLKQKKHTQ